MDFFLNFLNFFWDGFVDIGLKTVGADLWKFLEGAQFKQSSQKSKWWKTSWPEVMGPWEIFFHCD